MRSAVIRASQFTRPRGAGEGEGVMPLAIDLFCAYVVRCRIDGKVYVGITSRTLRQRWNEHLYASRRRPSGMTIAWAIAKHGAENFTMEAVCCARTWADICATEQALIEQYGCVVPNGYNLRPGGEGAYGHARTADAIERSAAKHRGRPCHPNTRAAASLAHKGKAKSPETRAKMSAARRGTTRSADTKAKLSAYWAARRERGEFKTPCAYHHHAKAMP